MLRKLALILDLLPEAPTPAPPTPARVAEPAVHTWEPPARDVEFVPTRVFSPDTQCFALRAQPQDTIVDAGPGVLSAVMSGGSDPTFVRTPRVYLSPYTVSSRPEIPARDLRTSGPSVTELVMTNACDVILRLLREHVSDLRDTFANHYGTTPRAIVMNVYHPFTCERADDPVHMRVGWVFHGTIGLAAFSEVPQYLSRSSSLGHHFPFEGRYRLDLSEISTVPRYDNRAISMAMEAGIATNTLNRLAFPAL
jgi:hypothetical protein